MNPSTLVFVVAALACPIGMGVMLWMMNRNMAGQQGKPAADPTTQVSEVDRLRALREQRRLLEQQIAEAEKIAALQARKQTLAHGHGLPAEISGDGQPQPAKSEN